MNPIKFKRHTNVVPVTLLEADDTEVHYELREMDAAARDDYLDSLSERMRTDKDGKTIGIKKFTGMQASLVFRCLKRKDGPPLTEAEIQTWPASAVHELFNAAQELNHLDVKETVPKND